MVEVIDGRKRTEHLLIDDPNHYESPKRNHHSAAGSDSARSLVGFRIVGVFSLIWAVAAWAEWFLVPIFYPANGGPVRIIMMLRRFASADAAKVGAIRLVAANSPQRTRNMSLLIIRLALLVSSAWAWTGPTAATPRRGAPCAVRYTIGTFSIKSRRLDSHQH
jgi:hypothetical protein